VCSSDLAAVLAQPWRPAWNAAAVVTVVASALLGAATHVGWDSITHADTFVTDRIAALRAAYDVPFVGPRTLHRILQHASTLVGLAATAWYLVRATRRASAAPPPIGSRLYVALVLAAGIAAGVAAMVVRMRSMHLTDPGSLIAGTISGVLAGTLVASVIVRITGGRR
jgi:hypothetical protein